MDCSTQAPRPFTVSWTLLRFISIESVMLTISSSAAPFSFCFPSFPASGSFPMSQLFASGGQSTGGSALASFPPKKGLISFRMDWLDLLAVQGTLKSLLQHHSSKASFLYGPTLITIQAYWKSHGFDYMDLCQQEMR